MKINFRDFKTMDIEGKEQVLDISKELGNAIYRETMDIGEVELARKIYLEGELELSEGEVEIVKSFMGSILILVYLLMMLLVPSPSFSCPRAYQFHPACTFYDVDYR